MKSILFTRFALLVCGVFSAVFILFPSFSFAEQPVGIAAASSSSSSNRPVSLAYTTPTDAVKGATVSAWKPIFRGVKMCEAFTITPRPIQIRAVRVDLKDPTIDFLVTPSNGSAPKDVGARTTSEFLSDYKCQVAINGSVFDVFAKKKGDPLDVQGLALSRGDLYSPGNQWDAFLISTNHKAWLARSPVNISGAYNGLSGFYALLIDGKNNGTMRELHPRSAIGVSRNGRYLVLMAVDGRQPGYSEGTTTAETAEWMRKLGAWNALNLDGGGSTALVVEQADGTPLALNRTCNTPPGAQRRVATHLGIFAQRLPAK